MQSKQFAALVAAAALTTAAAPARAHDDSLRAPPAAAEQTAWGIAGEPAQVGRTVTIDMADAMRFSPDSVSVREGDTVRFIVRNLGRLRHEMVVGTPDSLARHAALMAKFPDMVHDEAYLAHVEPGKTGEIVWRFNRAGMFGFACLVAGHYEAGMRGTLVVTPTSGETK